MPSPKYNNADGQKCQLAMPELPEVETVCSGLAPKLIGANILAIKTYTKKLRIPIPVKLLDRCVSDPSSRAAKRRGNPPTKRHCEPEGRSNPRAVGITNIIRRSKYIILELTNNYSIILHLGMSGRLTLKAIPDYNRAKHDHVVIHLDNNYLVAFNDPRRFGLITVVPSAELSKHKLITNLGAEPLVTKFQTQAKWTAENLAASLKGRSRDIKACIMDASIVVGVGNIYASESLYLAGIDPRRKAGSLKQEEISELYKAIKTTLTAAIKAGGSSLRDYRQADGKLGYFQHKFKVYDRAGQPCSSCKTKIERIRQAGRSTYLCPQCQR